MNKDDRNTNINNALKLGKTNSYLIRRCHRYIVVTVNAISFGMNKESGL